MEIELQLVGNIAEIKLRGRLDTQGVDQIETRFTASVVPGHHSAVVDLSEVCLITSMGLRMFLTVAKSLKRHNGRIVLYAPQPQVNEVLASARLGDIIPIVPYKEDALRSLPSSG